jgi:CheY-like chemotaxis protein
MLKKILIFDTKILLKPRHLDYEKFEFVSAFKNDKDFKINDDIEAIFIHRTDWQNGIFENLEEIIKNTQLRFTIIFFTGDLEEGDYSNIKNNDDYRIPFDFEAKLIGTDLFKKNVIFFLNSYEEKKETNYDILINGQNVKTNDQHVYKKKYYFLDSNKENDNFIEIKKTEFGEIDFFKTILNINSKYKNSYFIIKDTYYKQNDGINLVKYIRMSPFIDLSSNNPIIIDANIDSLVPFFDGIEDVSKYQIFLRKEFDCKKKEAGVLDQKLQKDFIKKIYYDKLTDKSHDRANIWGAFRLWHGFNLINNNKDVTEWVDEMPDMFSQPYYWKLFSLSYLDLIKKEDSDLNTVKESLIDEWQNYLSKKNSILYIDDELDKGWDVAFKNIVRGKETKLECYSIDSEDFNNSNKNKIISVLSNKIKTTDYTLIFLDLRLTADDKISGTYSDLSHLKNLTGIKLLEEIKKEKPNLPVIMITASNKSWIYQEIKQFGADGYWVKESPDFGIDSNYTIDNCEVLLKKIISIDHKYKEYDFLWDLFKHVEERKKDEEFLKQVNKKDKKDILDKISFRIKSAYSTLIHKPTKHRTDIFGYSPQEVAFLYIWSCQNDVKELRIYNQVKENQRLSLEELKEQDTICRLITLDNKTITLKKIKDDDLEIVGYKDESGHQLRNKESVITKKLLKMSNYNLLDEDLYKLRKYKRNKLSITHGSYLDVSKLSTRDIEKMSEIIKKII